MEQNGLSIRPQRRTAARRLLIDLLRWTTSDPRTGIASAIGSAWPRGAAANIAADGDRRPETWCVKTARHICRWCCQSSNVPRLKTRSPACIVPVLPDRSRLRPDAASSLRSDVVVAPSAGLKRKAKGRGGALPHGRDTAASEQFSVHQRVAQQISRNPYCAAVSPAGMSGLSRGRQRR